VTCLRAANNEQVWSERVQGPFYGSPIEIGGRLYNVTRKGELVVLGRWDKFRRSLASTWARGVTQHRPSPAAGCTCARSRTCLHWAGK
jgi:hypothetical protein